MVLSVLCRDLDTSRTSHDTIIAIKTLRGYRIFEINGRLCKLSHGFIRNHG